MKKAGEEVEIIYSHGLNISKLIFSKDGGLVNVIYPHKNISELVKDPFRLLEPSLYHLLAEFPMGLIYSMERDMISETTSRRVK